MDNHSSIVMPFDQFILHYLPVAKQFDNCYGMARKQAESQKVWPAYDEHTLVCYIFRDTTLVIDADFFNAFQGMNRLIVVLLAGVRVRCEDKRFESNQETVVTTDFFLGAASVLVHISQYEREKKIKSSQAQEIRLFLDAHASYTMHALFAGRYPLAITHSSYLLGTGAESKVLGSLIGTEDQMIEIRTKQYHLSPGAMSSVTIKGVVCDRAQVALEGLIIIGIGASRSEAFLTHGILRFGPCLVKSVPVLEIDNNDVHCSHASAIGGVDAAQVGYLRSRGLSASHAQRLLVAAYVGYDVFFEQKIIKKINSLPLL